MFFKDDFDHDASALRLTYPKKTLVIDMQRSRFMARSYSTPTKDARDDVIAANVSRHGRPRSMKANHRVAL